MNPYSEFTCLYTSQKQKKAKTWHDGHLKYFFNNSKVVLYDEKMNVLDSTFRRGSALAVGDDMDMDKHLVTVEDLTSEYATNSGDSGTHPKPAAPFPAPTHAAFQARSIVTPQQSKPTGRPLNPYASAAPTYTPVRPNGGAIAGSAGRPQQYQSINVESTNSYSGNVPTPDLKRKKWRAPFAQAELTPPVSADSPFDNLEDGDFENWDNSDMLNFDEATTPTPALKNRNGFATEMRAATGPVYTIPSASSFKTGAPAPSPASTSHPREAAPKRRKVGLSRPAGSLPAPAQSSIMAPHRPPSSQLEFPNAARCTNFTGKNSGQLLRRSMSLGSRFSTTNQYRDSMTFLIYEHLQIMVIEIAITMWSIKSSGKSNEGDSQDALYRSRGVHMHSGSTLRRRGDAYTGFPLYRGGPGGGVSMEASAVVQPSAQQGAVLSLCNKEHHSKYSKDDLWVVSQSPRLDAASTFFARSVFYGPSGNDVEITCLSPSDSSKCRDMLTRSNQVCAIRLFNGMSEFMMLDNLQDGLMKTQLLPTLLNYVPPELVKASKTSVFKAPSRMPEKSGCIVLTEEDGIDMENELQDTIEKYRLNYEQAVVLRNFAQTVVRAPGWSPSPEPPPILLVHGVFGAGKSFLIAVLIVFIDTLLSKARPLPKDVRSCRFLVTSMTNVAVDRILMALLDLDYNKFVRVGSLKKVARRVLPFTSQSTSTRKGEDVKELQAMLDDDSLSTKERIYVKDALKRFQREENRGIVEKADVVGVTCVASMFEVMDEASFPIVILDEASQLLEPMSLIPICRASCQKVVMVGDPLQLSPPINTNGDTDVKGLSRTLFDRSIEMGIKPIMLRTQYRCHERIAAISNALFYSNVLKTGSSLEDRAPLIDGLPTLTFIENQGQEIQNPRSKSYTNPAEIKLVVAIIQRLLSLNVPETSIGVISLYKSQADSIESVLNEQLKSSGQKGGVQISTVDAFQGSEKEIIIVSTVRTDAIGFIDNHQRVNVALTRAKRHMFIVGFSHLLNSNKTWSAILKNHCGRAQDGMVRSDTFMQRLKTLKPLQRQTTPPPQMRLVESEDEDEDEDLRDDRLENEDVYLNREEHDAGDHSADDGYGAPVPVVTRTGPRKYALYQSDEEESDDGYYDRDLSKSHAQPTRNFNGGTSDQRWNQGSAQEDHQSKSNGTVTQGDVQRYMERSTKVQEEPVHEAVDSYDDHAHGTDDDARGLENLLSAHREVPRTPLTPPPPPPVVVQRPSFSNSWVQSAKSESEPVRRATSSEYRNTVQSEKMTHEQNQDSWKPSTADEVVEKEVEEEQEQGEEVIWEMEDENEYDHETNKVPVPVPVELRALPDHHHHQADGYDKEIQENGKNSSSTPEDKAGKERLEVDPTSLQGLHQVGCTTMATRPSSQGFIYESQRIEDLDVVGFSQLSSPHGFGFEESHSGVTAGSGAAGVTAAVTSRLVGGVDFVDMRRPMATAAAFGALPRKEGEEEGEGQEEEKTMPITGGVFMDEEEDDISCLEVGDFDY